MIPATIAQNKKDVSIGSFIAVLKRTILNAPTIPKDRDKLELIVLITIEVTIANMTVVITIDLLYTTPQNVFL